MRKRNATTTLAFRFEIYTSICKIMFVIEEQAPSVCYVYYYGSDKEK